MALLFIRFSPGFTCYNDQWNDQHLLALKGVCDTGIPILSMQYILKSCEQLLRLPNDLL